MVRVARPSGKWTMWGRRAVTLCVTSSAPLDTIPGQLQCTRDTQHSSSPMTNRRSNQARSCRCCSCNVELKLRFRSRRNHSVTFRWTVSQSRRRLTNYNNNLPRRCYKLQRQHPFAAPIPPSPSFSLSTQPQQGATFWWSIAMKYAWKFVVAPQREEEK